MQEESPEGGRFKKEIMIDGQSYLLLIRDEGGSPELQVRRSHRFRSASARIRPFFTTFCVLSTPFVRNLVTAGEEWQFN